MSTQQNDASLARMVGEVFEWIATAPLFLKAERVQEEGVVHRPRIDEEPSSLAGKAAALFSWFEAAPHFVKEFSWAIHNREDADNDNND